MKRTLLLILSVLLCTALVCPAGATENQFVPSITYKDGPTIEKADLGGDPVGSCLVVSSITDAREKTTDIYQEDRDLLLEVYEKLTDGTMKLPLEGDYVIRELVDVSFRKTSCVENPHPHREDLKKEGTVLTVDFDLGVPKDIPVAVLTYIDGEWKPVEKVVNNGDGTVTVVFEDICPVAFCVDPFDVSLPPKTGDEARRELILWTGALILSAAAIPVLLYLRKKSGRKHSRGRK